MPVNSVCFRAVCGSFYWTFLAFMGKRAREKAAMRVRSVSVRAPVAVVLVFLFSFLLRCGDIEANPGPTKKQSTLTGQTQGQAQGGEKSSDQPTIADVVRMLSSLDQKMTTMDRKMDSIHSSMKEQMDRLQSDFDNVAKENKELKEKIDKLESKVDDLEGRSRRNNLIFHGIPHPQGQSESWADCEKSVKSVLREELGIEDEIEIERAHRLRSGKGPHPIIVCFSSFKDRERILAGRRVLKNKRSTVFVSEDFTPRVRDRRRQLLPFLKEAKAANKKAFLRFDTLVIEGKTFVFDSTTSGLVERQRRE